MVRGGEVSIGRGLGDKVTLADTFVEVAGSTNIIETGTARCRLTPRIAAVVYTIDTETGGTRRGGAACRATGL